MKNWFLSNSSPLNKSIYSTKKNINIIQQSVDDWNVKHHTENVMESIDRIKLFVNFVKKRLLLIDGEAQASIQHLPINYCWFQMQLYKNSIICLYSVKFHLGLANNNFSSLPFFCGGGAFFPHSQNFFYTKNKNQVFISHSQNFFYTKNKNQVFIFNINKGHL